MLVDYFSSSRPLPCFTSSSRHLLPLVSLLCLLVVLDAQPVTVSLLEAVSLHWSESVAGMFDQILHCPCSEVAANVG
jgi:hypothetical protein